MRPGLTSAGGRLSVLAGLLQIALDGDSGPSRGLPEKHFVEGKVSFFREF